MLRILKVAVGLVLALFPALSHAQQACSFSYPVGIADGSTAPLTNNHPVNGTNLPQYGRHLGADYWSGGGCTDFGADIWAVANGEVVEIVDGLGSYLDVVVIRHDVPDIGRVYSMYGHISRDTALAEGQRVTRRQKIGTIDNVLAYFSPCHLHFELLNESAYQNGPFCNGCANAGYNVSPGYDRSLGVEWDMLPTGDRYLHVLNDGIADNGWFDTDPFISARLNASCGVPDYETTATRTPEAVWRDRPTGTMDITVRNSGTLAWRAADSFRLASTAENRFIWNAQQGYCNGPTDCRVYLPGDVPPGEEVTFTFDIRLDEGLDSPSGTAFKVGWQMVKDGDAAIGFFGPQSEEVVVLCESSSSAACDGQATSDADAGAPNSQTGTPPAQADAGSPDAAQPDSGTSSPPGADADESGSVVGSGSACATGTGAPSVALLLLALLAPRRRRRNSGAYYF